VGRTIGAMQRREAVNSKNWKATDAQKVYRYARSELFRLSRKIN